MLISNCNFSLLLPPITPIIGLKCLVLKALYHCAISFFITFVFLKIWRFGKFILAKSEPHHAYSCHAYKKKTCMFFFFFSFWKCSLKCWIGAKIQLIWAIFGCFWAQFGSKYVIFLSNFIKKYIYFSYLYSIETIWALEHLCWRSKFLWSLCPVVHKGLKNW